MFNFCNITDVDKHPQQEAIHFLLPAGGVKDLSGTKGVQIVWFQVCSKGNECSRLNLIHNVYRHTEGCLYG